jgi:hypothetical protein
MELVQIYFSEPASAADFPPGCSFLLLFIAISWLLILRVRVLSFQPILRLLSRRLLSFI